MTDTVSLSEYRAKLSQDSTKWLPIDLARALLRDLESECGKDGNKIKRIIVHFMAENENGEDVFGHYAAGCSFAEHFELLCLAMDDTVARRKGLE